MKKSTLFAALAVSGIILILIGWAYNSFYKVNERITVGPSSADPKVAPPGSKGYEIWFSGVGWADTGVWITPNTRIIVLPLERNPRQPFDIKVAWNYAASTLGPDDTFGLIATIAGPEKDVSFDSHIGVISKPQKIWIRADPEASQKDLGSLGFHLKMIVFPAIDLVDKKVQERTALDYVEIVVCLALAVILGCVFFKMRTKA